MYPDDVKYSDSHEWVRVSGDVATIGITQYAASEIGDIVGVEMPRVGAEAKAGDSLVGLESVKAVVYVMAPVSLRVTKVNESLTTDPEPIAGDPYGSGWILEVELTDKSEMDRLMTREEYVAFIGGG